MEQPKQENAKQLGLLKALKGSPEEWNSFVKEQVGDTPTYSGLDAMAMKTGQNAINAKRHSDIARKLNLNPLVMGFDDMEKSAALDQSGWEILGNTAKGFAANTGAGFLDWFASGWDPKGIYDMAVGNTEQDFGNWLTDITSDLRDSAEEATPLYQTGDMWSAGYWSNQIKQLGYSVGLATGGILEQIAMASVTGGAGNAATAPLKIKNALSLGRSAFTGMRAGLGEAYLNGIDTAEQVKEKYLDLGYSEEDATKKAGQAASAGFRLEAGPLVALNMLQYMSVFSKGTGAFTKTPGIEYGVSSVVEGGLGRLVPGSKLGKVGLSMVAEATEEAYQGGVSAYVQDKDIFTQEMMDSAIGGALGGLLLPGVGGIFKKLAGGTNAVQYEKMQEEFVAGAVNRTAEVFAQKANIEKEFEQAKSAYDADKSKANLARYNEVAAKVQEAQYNTHLANTINSLQLDYINGNNTAYESHIEQMQDLLDATNNVNSQEGVETLKKHGILDDSGKERFPGALETIKTTFEQNIKDSANIKKLLENNLTHVTADFEAAYDITKKEYIITKELQEVNKLNGALNTMYTNDTQFNQLSSVGQQRFKLEAELESLQNITVLSETDKALKTQLKEELDGSAPFSVQDTRILGSINVRPYINSLTSINSINKAIDSNNQSLSELRNEENINLKVLERKKEKVKTAKTKEQVERVVAEAKKEGVATPELEQEAKTKVDNIQADDTVKEVSPEFKAQELETEEPAPTEDSATPTSEDDKVNSLLASLFASGQVSSSSNEDIDFDAEDQLFSPRNFNPVTLSPEVVSDLTDAIGAAVSAMDSKLGRPTNFDDYVRRQIEISTYDKVDKAFEAITYAWSLTGRDTSIANAVYDKYFNAEQRVSQFYDNFLSQEETVEATNKVVDQAVVDNSVVTRYDTNNRPLEKDLSSDDTSKTTSSSPKLAFLGMQYQEVKNEDGKIVRIPVSASLNSATPIKNHDVLNPDLIKEGSKLKVEVLQGEDLDKTLVTTWRFNQEEKRLIPSSVPFSSLKLTPGSVEYNSKVPMLVTDESGKGIAFIHDTEWYNQNNVGGNTPLEQRENIAKGIQELKDLRNNILAGNNNIEVTTRRFGHIFKLDKLATNNEPMVLSKATGDTKLAIASTFTELSDGNKSKGTLNKNLKFVNNFEKNNLNRGGLYDIRHVNTEADGTKQYIALPVFTNNPSQGETINDVAYNNIKHSLLASVLLNNSTNKVLLKSLEDKYGMTLSKATAIQQAIMRTTSPERIDIQNQMDKYLKMFVEVSNSNSEFLQKLEDKVSMSKNGAGLKFPNDTNYIVLDNNILKMYVKDDNGVPRSDDGRDTIPGLFLGPKVGTQFVLDFMDKFFTGNDGAFRQTGFKQSMAQLGKNNPMMVMDSAGNVSEYKGGNGENTYDGYVKDNVKTNIQSFAIKDEQGNTKWVTDTQPMIYFKVSDPEVKVEQKVTVSEEMKLAATETASQIANEEVAELKEAVSVLPDDLAQEILSDMDFIMGDDSEGIDYSFSRRDFEGNIQSALGDIELNMISSLNPIEQKKLVNSLFNLILADTGINKGMVNLADIVRNIDSAIETYLVPQIEMFKDRAERLRLTNPTDPKLISYLSQLDKHIAKMEVIVEEKSKIISKGITEDNKGVLYVKFERFFAEELTTSEDLIMDDNGEIDWSFNTSALEKDVKLSFSNNLKIFFANVVKQNPETRADIKNFTGLNDYVAVDDVIQSLTEVMVGLPSSIEHLKNILEVKKANPIYEQILNKINSTTEDVQNEILYKMIQSKLDMHMVLYSYNSETKSYKLQIINPNSSDSSIRLNLQWQANFKGSDLLKNVNEVRVYDIDKVRELISEIETLGARTDFTTPEAIAETKKVLSQLGIDVSDNTIENVLQQGKEFVLGKGLIGIFRSNLKNIIGKTTEGNLLDFEEEGNNPYSNAAGVVSSLIETEIDLNGTKVSKSFRVGGKTIQGAIQKMMVYDVKESLKDTESTLFQALKQIPYSAQNYVLNMLEEDEKFRENFDVGFVSLEAIKQVKQKVYDDRKINKLAETDNMLTQYAFFQNKLRELSYTDANYPDLKFRMAHMFNPSLSDKEQMIVYSTAVVDLTYKDFNISQDKVELSDSVVGFVTRQLFDSEFDRIVSTYTNPTNIKNYDGAAKRFLTIPAFNNIESAPGVNIHTVLQRAVAGKDADFSAIKESVREKAEAIIRGALQFDVNSKVNTEDYTGSWFEKGFLIEGPKGVEINFFDTKYLGSKLDGNSTLGRDKLAQIAAYDFVINQFLHQATTYQLFAGDMALYAPSVGKFTKDGVVDNVALSRAVGESITKRMAMLIAPGNKLANSHGDKYRQIFVNDPIKITSTAREFIKQYYGAVSQENTDLLTSLNQIENNIRNLYKSRRESADFDNRLDQLDSDRSRVLKSLGKQNPDIAGYFAIEGTDAQEYTTWKEHMDILFRQGRLSVSEKATVQAAYNKLEQGQDLNSSELALVMNPIKPVYAGSTIFHNNEGEASVNRIVYIKSSSFPLLPQLTRDFKLDKVRQQMEALQSNTGQNVRLSYQTANKVGAVNTKLTTNDLYNLDFNEMYSTDANGVPQGKLADAVLELDRNNFKIQQDTPYKTAKFMKKYQDDMTTMGSQMWKIILGNGLNKERRSIFPNLFGDELVAKINTLLAADKQALIIPKDGMISGMDLDKIKFHAEKMYFDIQRELLYDELGFSSSGVPIDVNETTKLLHSLLHREVTTRQYPDSMIDSLKLVEDNKGNLEFLTPIWLSNNSNKFESLMQAIITNRLIQISLPGNQLISSSSEGFEKSDITSMDKVSQDIQSKVVWIDPNHTGELKATFIDGKVKESEILIQSKFRVVTKDSKGKKSIKLIDLTSDEYSYMKDGFRYLNLDAIDEELLSSFSFRIPTSSHQSGAILKVVGFLPEASGDMVVVPKEHTQQIGEDFDIDKRTLYKLNYYVDETGKIQKLRYTEDVNSDMIDRFLLALDETVGDNLLDTKAKKLQTKVLENAMIDIYKSVYTSPDNEIQKKISKILSFDNATNTANMIYDRLNSVNDTEYFTILSDDYQRAQMKLGADGKTGIGAHSNAVTFQAQLERATNPIVIEKEVPIFEGEEVRFAYVPSEVTIGDYTSDGTLGRIATLDRERNIGDVHTENQNSSTDNIKAQIMGKRNENSYTMNVLIQMTYRGFDMVPFTPRNEGDPTSVQMPSLFIAQPILRRFVELSEQNKSITAEYDGQANTTIIRKLLQEFDPEGVTDAKFGLSEDGSVTTEFLRESDYNEASRRMTGDALYDNLIADVSDPFIQIAVLQKFFELSAEGQDLNNYQRLINLSTSGLGISYFNVLDRLSVLNGVTQNKTFRNIDNLIGDFIPDNEDTAAEYGRLISEGYTLLGNNYIKPTTTEGTVLINSVKVGINVMDQLFPYRMSFIPNAIETIIDNKSRVPSKRQKEDLQYKIVDSLKDFIYASPTSGLFRGDVNAERERLFFNKPGNESLGHYMSRLKRSKSPLMFSNELLKSFNFDAITSDGSPSIIKHQTDQNSTFDKTDKYVSFLELIQDDRTKLPPYNGEEMTPRKLGQDLATYAYLANNEKGAIGFRDFVNVKYLEIIGFTDKLRDSNTYTSNDSVWYKREEFLRQFYQHNPEEASILSPNNIIVEGFEEVNKTAVNALNSMRAKNENRNNDFKSAAATFLANLTNFTLDPIKAGNMYRPFIAVRDTSLRLTDNQYKLFMYDEGSREYVQIPTLGSFGYNEFNPNTIQQSSSIYPNIPYGAISKVEFIPDTVGFEDTVKTEDLLGDAPTVNSVLEFLSGVGEERFNDLAKELLPYINPDTKIVIDANPPVTGEFRTGVYKHSTNTIYLHPNLIENAKQYYPTEKPFVVLQEIVMEEILHSMTVDTLKKYGKSNPDGSYVPNADAPAFIERLSALYKVAKDNVNSDEYYTKDIFEFVAGSFVSEDFKNLLNETKQGSKTLYELFKQAIGAMVRHLRGSTYSDEVAKTAMDLIKYRNSPISVAKPTVSPLDAMKAKDTAIENTVNKITNEPAVLPTKQSTEIPLAGVTSYNAEASLRLVDRFAKGDTLIVNNPQDRKAFPSEMKFMTDVISYVQSIAPEGKGVKDMVTITNLEDGKQSISLNKVKPSLEDLMKSGMFSSGGDDYGFRLPEIKNCK